MLTKSEAKQAVLNKRRVLHVGCGRAGPERLPAHFQLAEWEEIRLDIDPSVQPDIVASITDLSALGAGSIDAIWSSHNLEHLGTFDVPVALQEFRRVLRADGFLAATVPDLRAVARQIVAGNLDRILYSSVAGPITALDIVFGHQASIARGNGYMAHRTGFTAQTLGQALIDAGFGEVRVHEGRQWSLWAVALMPDAPLSVFEDMGCLVV